MKKKFCKKIGAGLMAAALAAGMLQTGVLPVTVHAAADTIKTMNLDTSYLAPSDGTWDADNDHKVYFGQYSDSPTAFRVLKVGADENTGQSTMMLDCDTILETKAFDSDSKANTGQFGGYPNGWKNSDLESWLNGDNYYNNQNVFTSAEKSAIAETVLSQDEQDNPYTAGDYSHSYEDDEAEDYVYLLSAKEADTLYAGNDARKKTGGNGYWWLRSAHANDYFGAGSVDFDGFVKAAVVGNHLVGLCPALNIDLSSVLFISANGVSKSSAGGSLTQVTADTTTKAWKLTLLDESKTVKVTDGAPVTQIGKTITVPYTYTGSDVTQISVMITDGAYTASGTEILYYGKLNTDLSSSSGEGSGTFTLPDELPDGGYKIYILAEKVNGEKITDYASAPAEITVAETKTPEANLPEGTYCDNQSVTLSSATDGASIYYTMTMGGSEPADPATEGTLYTGAISLTGTEGSSVTYQMKAVAVKDGMVTSSIASFTYTISIPEKTYAVTVVNGTGGGSYVAGAAVTITADTAEVGKRFREWTGVDGLTFTENTDKTSATATFTMPANDVTVTAVYEDIAETPTADLPEGTYSENQSVTLSSATDGASIYYTMTTDGNEPADPAVAGTLYTGAISLTGTEGSSVTYQMKAIAVKEDMADSSIASFAYTISIPATTYAVTVVNGTGGGSYAAGAAVTITADTAGSGKRFREWSGVDGLMFAENTDKTSATATFTMPANDVAVTAVYESISSAGSGSGVITQPQDAPIKEDETAAPDGVEVTTVVYRDEDGNITGSKVVSVIPEADQNTSATITVTRDEQENVIDASAEVTTVRTGKTAGVVGTVSGNVVSRIIEAAGVEPVEITVNVTGIKGKTKYTVTVDSADLKAGNELKAVAIDPETGEYLLVNARTYTVTQEGGIEVSLHSGRNYELVTVEKAAAIEAAILKTIKIEKASVTLKPGKTTYIRLDSVLNMDNVKKITYSSNKKKVATVDKNGKITAEKAGTATISAKVTLKSGASKTVKMKIKVKNKTGNPLFWLQQLYLRI